MVLGSRLVVWAIGAAAFLLPPLVAGQDFEPFSGLWWVPEEPGSGIAIEFQDDISGNITAFVAIYTYDEAGNPVWYVGNDDYVNRSLTVELSSATNGSCLDGCIPGSAQVEPIGKSVTIDFFGSHAAVMRLGDGEQKQLRAFYFAAPLAALGDTSQFGAIAVPDITGTWVLSLIHI